MAPMILLSFVLFSFVCFYTGLDNVVKGLECQLNPNNPAKVWYTLSVSPPARHESNSNFTIKRENGQLSYTSIQAAIDSITDGNDKWIRIFKINLHKSCILLEGRYAQKTLIEFNAHQDTLESATFTSLAENFVAKHITFVNTHNYNLYGRGTRNQNANANDVTQAVAAMIYGDKSAFYSCGFFGVQDTLWDSQGRHYFKNCYIDGAFDFIMGNGQSIYDECIIRVLGNAIAAYGGVGYITAQSRSSDEDPSGFVFKGGVVEGNGKAWLGRAWGSHSRVIFNDKKIKSKQKFNDIIVPERWSPWDFENDPVKHFTYTDQNCDGPGNDTSRRQFNTTLTDLQMQQFIDLSYIVAEGWISNQP
ncbi:hypothetical protein MKW98_024454 [Papaver atlanticum]|uniref:pectinesterase n=1 Tax=Papaver atlanticum TaxID=357466 RepID=A0AAD4XNP1_9MAGN|nr:hypothetical protein MKW98_024454 [Papaver atlanticum]